MMISPIWNKFVRRLHNKTYPGNFDGFSTEWIASNLIDLSINQEFRLMLYDHSPDFQDEDWNRTHPAAYVQGYEAKKDCKVRFIGCRSLLSEQVGNNLGEQVLKARKGQAFYVIGQLALIPWSVYVQTPEEGEFEPVSEAEAA